MDKETTRDELTNRNVKSPLERAGIEDSGMQKKHDIIEVTVLLMHETDAAYLVSEDAASGKKIWLPKSQCELDSVDEEGFAQIQLPEWLAMEKGLI